MYEPKIRRPTGLLARLDRATPWFQGLRTLKWMLGFALALILLPVASLWSPTLETAFGNQQWLAVGVSTVALLFASWGAMLCSSLRITAEQSRAQLRGEVRTDLMALEHLLELPITRFQRYLLHALAFPGVLVLVAGSPEPWRATLSAAAAVVFANVVGAILEESILPRGTSDDPGKQRGRFHRIVAGVVTDRVRQVFETIRRPVSFVVARMS